MIGAAQRAWVPCAARLALALALSSCLDLGGGPSFPLQDRVAERDGALALVRRSSDGSLVRARFDPRGSAVLDPGFAEPPWNERELELVLAAALGGPLLRRGVTLSVDPASASHLFATDAQGRVLRLELDPAGAPRIVELVAGFATSLPRRWTIARSAGALVLEAPDGGRLEFELR